MDGSSGLVMIPLITALGAGLTVWLVLPVGAARRVEVGANDHRITGTTPVLPWSLISIAVVGTAATKPSISVLALLSTLALAGLFGASRWSRRMAASKLKQDQLIALPPTLDLIAVVLGAGGTISEAIDVVSLRGEAAVQTVFASFQARRKSGQALTMVLSEAPSQLGQVYWPLMRALLATERDGAPIASLLVRLADEAEAGRRRATEAQAKRLSVKLLFPLVGCFLPAVILGAVLPLVLVTSSDLFNR